MSRDAKKPFTSLQLRTLLIVLLVLLLAGVVGGFYMTSQWLTTRSQAVFSNIESLNRDRLSLSEAAALRQQLEALADERTKAALVTTSADQYQSQAIQDINRYAELTGVAVRDIQFPETPATEKLKNVTVSFNNPVPFERLLRFLQLVEGNLPKMNVTKLELTANNRNLSVIELHIGVWAS